MIENHQKYPKVKVHIRDLFEFTSARRGQKPSAPWVQFERSSSPRSTAPRNGVTGSTGDLKHDSPQQRNITASCYLRNLLKNSGILKETTAFWWSCLEHVGVSENGVRPPNCNFNISKMMIKHWKFGVPYFHTKLFGTSYYHVPSMFRVTWAPPCSSVWKWGPRAWTTRWDRVASETWWGPVGKIAGDWGYESASDVQQLLFSISLIGVQRGTGVQLWWKIACTVWQQELIFFKKNVEKLQSATKSRWKGFHMREPPRYVHYYGLWGFSNLRGRIRPLVRSMVSNWHVNPHIKDILTE